jgi:hypothetical protein
VITERTTRRKEALSKKKAEEKLAYEAAYYEERRCIEVVQAAAVVGMQHSVATGWKALPSSPTFFDEGHIRLISASHRPRSTRASPPSARTSSSRRWQPRLHPTCATLGSAWTRTTRLTPHHRQCGGGMSSYAMTYWSRVFHQSDERKIFGDYKNLVVNRNESSMSHRCGGIQSLVNKLHGFLVAIQKRQERGRDHAFSYTYHTLLVCIVQCCSYFVVEGCSIHV